MSEVAAGLEPKDLLKPLDSKQQRLVEVIAEGFEANSKQWPIFDYVEGTLENEGLGGHSEGAPNRRRANRLA